MASVQFEQTLASVAFKNTFRDYYRRRGAQLFGVMRIGANNELSVMTRWDRHEPLDNATPREVMGRDVKAGVKLQ